MATDISTLSINVGGQTLIIYNNRQPDVYRYEDIYDPDDPISGKYVPSLRSIILKDNGSLWYVAAVDQQTFKSTLKPCGITDVYDQSEIIKIISYGNDKYCVYQDTRTSPYKLVVDAKLLFYGNNLVEYALYRTTASGKEECLSMYFDQTDKFLSNRIPMQRVSGQYPAYKWPTNCHTTLPLVEGEPVVMRVFNNLGNVAAEITLFVRNAVWNNDLASYINPIVGLDARCLQMKGDDFYIYPKQDPSHLNITPFLTYADGSEVDLVIDNRKTFMYGLDQYYPSYDGYSQTLLFKYFLNTQESAIHGDGDADVRFVTCTKKLVVLANENTYIVKLSVIPIWNGVTESWRLKFFAYSDRRNAMYDVTDLCHYSQGMEFTGDSSKWGVLQHIQVTYDLQTIFDTDNPIPGVQDVYITVWDPSNYECFTFSDGEYSNHVYGVDGSITRRPVIHWDEELNQYYIPTSVFRSWESVVESFYHLATPPFDTRIESNAPTPSYFTVRDAETGHQIIGAPIAAENFGAAWSVLVELDSYVNKTVIVEFLDYVNNAFTVLYGVPVRVYKSETGYNTENNNIYEP